MLVLASMVSTLEAWSYRARMGCDRAIANAVGHPGHGVMGTLREALRELDAAAVLRNRGGLQEATVKILAASGEPVVPATGQVHRPKRETRRRLELALDVAYMLAMRKSVNSTPAIRHVWADSSPQGGHKWLWLQSVSVPLAELVPTWRAVARLAHLVRDREAACAGHGPLRLTDWLGWHLIHDQAD